MPDLGVSVAGGKTSFKLWAPTAQKVEVAIYADGVGLTQSMLPASFDAATGVWTASGDGDLSGRYYRYVVDVFVRGVGLVRGAGSPLPEPAELTLPNTRSPLMGLRHFNQPSASWWSR